MSKQLDKDKVKNNVTEAMAALNTLLNDCVEINLKKADLLSYWLKDYSQYIKTEADFSPRSLRRYKRGEVIKANLGFNVGSEEGGLHYCIVMDNNNAQSSRTITVIPLTSVKEDKDINHLRYGEVYLGSDLKDKIEEKYSSLLDKLSLESQFILNLLSGKDVIKTKKEVNELLDMFKIAQNISNELAHMKNGSIALVAQITTISKMKIYDPKTDKDPLSKIKLSDESLTAIDAKLQELYTYKPKTKN